MTPIGSAGHACLAHVAHQLISNVWCFRCRCPRVSRDEHVNWNATERSGASCSAMATSVAVPVPLLQPAATIWEQHKELQVQQCSYSNSYILSKLLCTTLCHSLATIVEQPQQVHLAYHSTATPKPELQQCMSTASTIQVWTTHLPPSLNSLSRSTSPITEMPLRGSS